MSFQPLTRDEFLAIWRTLVDPSYSQPIEAAAHAQGLDVFAQMAAQFSRVEVAGNQTFGRLYIRPHSSQTSPPASGAAVATTTLVVTRPAPAMGAITLIAGVEFVATLRTPTGVEIDGVRFQVSADTTMADGELGPLDVPAQSVRVGYSNNVLAGSISHFAPRGTARVIGATVEAGNVIRDAAGADGGDRFTPAMIGQYVRLVGGANGGGVPRLIVSATQSTATNPTASIVVDGSALSFPDTLTRAEALEFEDLGLTVSQPDDATGGLDAWLDALGEERNCPRQAGESDDAYRLRIETLADVVSPGAIQRIANRILSPLGIPWRLLETRDPSGLRGFVFDLDPYDYGSVSDGQVLLSLERSVRYFVIAVGIGNQGEFGMAYDAPYPNNAYDATNVEALNFYDGSPVVYLSAIAALWAAVNGARAGGIAFDVIQDPSL